ncbi:MAG TPA: hypothetical protein VGO68_18405 [Pyrinomonadaceae bacterium]|jgi:hypothetical protein|nr:hypothetical protein [Pyrinomonadaceae bacterium]
MAIEKNMVQVARSVRFLAILFALLLSGCAALQPPSTTGPRGAESLYPVLLIEDAQRQEATVAALSRLGQATRLSGSEPQLQPVTGTILSLPANAGSALFLPKLGAGATMTEEETRESLRRFIRVWQELIGSDPGKLSLIELTDQPDGSKLATYEQRPFRYPIRGNYGKLQIIFTSDRRVVNLSSTCIPDADRIQSALSALNTRPKAEDAIQQLRTKGLVYLDANGNKQTLTIPTSSNINARQMTVYVLPAKNRPEALEFHLAWEMELTNAPIKLAYVDALTGEIVATEVA